MTSLIRRATLLTAVGLLAASAAMAGVPSTGTSTQPLGISLVAHTGGIADGVAIGGSTYTIRDAASNPVANSVVVMNFSTCTDVRLCSITQPAGLFVNCAAKTVSAVTDASGVVTFRVVGGGLTSGVAIIAPCVSVTADGVALNTIRSSTCDMNGSGGVTSADITLAKNDNNTNPARTRSDFNKSGSVTSADITLLKNVDNGTGSDSSCDTYCP